MDGTVYELASAGMLPGPMLVGIRDRAGNHLIITRHYIPTHLVTRIPPPNGSSPRT